MNPIPDVQCDAPIMVHGKPIAQVRRRPARKSQSCGMFRKEQGEPVQPDSKAALGKENRIPTTSGSHNQSAEEVMAGTLLRCRVNPV